MTPTRTSWKPPRCWPTFAARTRQAAPARLRRQRLGRDQRKELERTLARHRDPAYRARRRSAKFCCARTGPPRARTSRKIDRARSTCSASRASWCSTRSSTATARGSNARAHDLDLIYGTADAHNRAMLDFCSVDRRLLPTAYIPLADFARTRAIAERAVADRLSGAADSVCVSAQPLAQPHRFVPAMGDRRRRGHADRVPRRRRRRAARSEVLRQRLACAAGLSRRRGEFPFRRLHGDSDAGDADAGDA